MSFKGPLHESPVPELVDDHRRAGEDLEDLEGEPAWKRRRESSVGWVHRLLRWIEAPKLLR